MTVDHIRSLAQRYHACDPNDYADLITEDFEGHDGMGHTWKKKFQVDGLLADLQSFAGLHDVIHDTIVEGGKVAVRFTRSGTFVRKFEEYEPTNGSVNFDVIEILAFRDGKICEGWFYNDDSTVARTLRGET
jgi:predicted ester cyclase